MGEFFYVNRIDFTPPDFVTLECMSSDRRVLPKVHNLKKQALLLMGGGRDSAITAMCFQRTDYPHNCMILNHIPSALAVTAAVGCKSPIVISREIDGRLLDLNKKRFLNGHTPFSAYLAFLGALCLPLYNFSQIIVSNELSSNDGNITYLGHIINHQYSKTSEFETSFNDYLQAYLVCDGQYLSFTRDLNELQTGKAFSQLRSLFGVAKSCNRKQKEDKWCGECPKCLSVFLSTYPFVSSPDLQLIFGANFFDNPNCIPALEQLTGVRDHKPFECVGTIKEMKVALYLCLQKANEDGGMSSALQHMQRAVSFPDDIETLSRVFVSPVQQNVSGHPASAILSLLI